MWERGQVEKVFSQLWRGALLRHWQDSVNGVDCSVVLTLALVPPQNVILGWFRNLYTGLTLECGSLVLSTMISLDNSCDFGAPSAVVCPCRFGLTIQRRGVVSTGEGLASSFASSRRTNSTILLSSTMASGNRYLMERYHQFLSYHGAAPTEFADDCL